MSSYALLCNNANMDSQVCINNPAAIAEALTAIFKSKKWNQSRIAMESGIHQSQVCRILSGKFKRCSKSVLILCKYANLSLVQKNTDPRANEQLMKALSLAWDGTDAHAEMIAKLLITIGEFRSITMQ